MSYWLDSVRTYLIARNLGGGTTGWGIYESHLVETPDRMIALFATNGRPPNTLDFGFMRVSMQLRVRAERQAVLVAHDKWRACFDALHNARQNSYEDGQLQGFNAIFATQVDPMSFTDANGRVNLTSGFDLVINT